jgi:hypothetical protein
LGLTGAMDKWDFAIYKYSNNYYNLEEWFFTGAGKVNGAVNGAMEADGGLSHIIGRYILYCL